MEITTYYLIIILLRIIAGIICYDIARKRNRNPRIAFALGFLFGSFGIIGYVIAGDKKTEDKVPSASASKYAIPKISQNSKTQQTIVYPHQTTYNSLLRRIQWKEKRNTILNRDHNKCQYCGSCCNLQVHHKYYSKYPDGKKVDPWNYPDDALITLCAKCHRRIHFNTKIKVYFRKYDS